jgi:hypothetical protein
MRRVLMLSRAVWAGVVQHRKLGPTREIVQSYATHRPKPVVDFQPGRYTAIQESSEVFHVGGITSPVVV